MKEILPKFSKHHRLGMKLKSQLTSFIKYYFSVHYVKLQPLSTPHNSSVSPPGWPLYPLRYKSKAPSIFWLSFAGVKSQVSAQAHHVPLYCNASCTFSVAADIAGTGFCWSCGNFNKQLFLVSPAYEIHDTWIRGRWGWPPLGGTKTLPSPLALSWCHWTQFVCFDFLFP